MKTGWITVGGKEYYLNGSGAWIPDAKKTIIHPAVTLAIQAQIQKIYIK